MSTENCTNCESFPKRAKIWCSKCDTFLCSDCSTSIHQLRALRSHSTVPADQKPKSCQRHGEPLKYWCSQDNTLLCQTCFDIEHAGHRIQLAYETAVEEIKKLEEQTTRAQSALNIKLEMTFQKSRTNETAIKSTIAQVFNQIRAIVNQREQELINKVDTIETKNQQLIQEHHHVLQSLKKQLIDFSSTLQKLKPNINPAPILEQRGPLKSTIDHLNMKIGNCTIPQPTTFQLMGTRNFETKMTDVLPLIYLKTIPLVPTLPLTTRWNPQGVTVLKGLIQPRGLAVDEDDGTMYVADYGNHRIVANTPGSNDTNGRVVAGGNGQGSGLNQLNGPVDILIDKKTQSLVISDWGNNRIMRWPLKERTEQGEIMIDNIPGCFGLAMNNEGTLYVSSTSTHDVRRFTPGDKTETVVAGGNGQGNGLHQFNTPIYIAVDGKGALYVSDSANHRIMKWSQGATRGVVVAGHGGRGKDLTQLAHPRRVLVDTNETVYVAEGGDNQRVTRWGKGATKGEIIVGGNGEGSQANQFNWPIGLSFDSRGHHLFVTDINNNRVQRFLIV